MTKKRSIRTLILKIRPNRVSQVAPLSTKEKLELKERILMEIQRKAFC